MDQVQKTYTQWLGQPGMDKALLEELRGMDEQTKYDSFYRDLEFGTAGLRGVLGAGTNRMNIYVVRRATQAVADYLKARRCPSAPPLPTTAVSALTCSRVRPQRSLPQTASLRISIPGSSRCPH